MRLREYLEIQNGLKSKLRESVTIPVNLTDEEFQEWLSNNWEIVFKDASIDDILTWYYKNAGPNGYTIPEWVSDYGHVIFDKCCPIAISLVTLVTSKTFASFINDYIQNLPAKVTPNTLVEIVDEIIYRFLVDETPDNGEVTGVYAQGHTNDSFLYFIPDTNTQYTDTIADVLHINYNDDEMELNAADTFKDYLRSIFTDANCSTWADAVKAIVENFSANEF